jgi:hypothetical protein
MVDIVGKILNKKYFIYKEIKNDGTFIHYAAEDAFRNRYILLRLIDCGNRDDSFQNISDFFEVSGLDGAPEFVESLRSPFEKLLVLRKNEPNSKEISAPPNLSLKKLKRNATVREVILAIVFIIVAATAKILTNSAQAQGGSIFSFPKLNRPAVEEKFLNYDSRIDLYGETALENYDAIYGELLELYSFGGPNPDMWITDSSLECETARDGDFTYLNYYNNSTQTYEFLEINERTGVRKVVNGDLCVSNIIISNDKIYFTNFNDNYYLYSIDRNGANLKPIVEMPVAYLQTNASGNAIFFISIDETDNIPKIFSCDADGKNIEIFKSSYDKNSYDFFNYIRMRDVLSFKKMDYFDKIPLKFDYGYSDASEKDGSFYAIDFICDVLLEFDPNGKRKYLALMADVFLLYEDALYYQLRGEEELYRYDLTTGVSKIVYENVRNIYEANKNKLYVSLNDESGTSYSLSELIYENGDYKLGRSYQITDYHKEDTAIFISNFSSNGQ